MIQEPVAVQLAGNGSAGTAGRPAAESIIAAVTFLLLPLRRAQDMEESGSIRTLLVPTRRGKEVQNGDDVAVRSAALASPRMPARDPRRPGLLGRFWSFVDEVMRWAAGRAEG